MHIYMHACECIKKKIYTYTYYTQKTCICAYMYIQIHSCISAARAGQGQIAFLVFTNPAGLVGRAVSILSCVGAPFRSSVPVFRYPILGPGICSHTVGYPKKEVWYRPTSSWNVARTGGLIQELQERGIVYTSYAPRLTWQVQFWTASLQVTQILVPTVSAKRLQVVMFAALLVPMIFVWGAGVTGLWVVRLQRSGGKSLFPVISESR